MKGIAMPQNNLSPALMFAAAIWLTAIFIFVLMVIATLVSLISESRTEAKSRSKMQIKFAIVVTRFKILSERILKNRYTSDNP